MEISLRHYQRENVNTLRYFYSKKISSLLYVLPTGGGKTFVFCHIAREAIKKKNRVLILVHRQELIDQTCNSLKALGLGFGIIARGHETDYEKYIQICSVQTLVRRINVLPNNYCQLLIVDEAHHAVAGSWDKIISTFSEAKVLGVTATPERCDGKGLKSKFQEMIIGPQMAELQQQEYLAPYRVFAPPEQIDLSLLKKRAGDYAREDVDKQVTTQHFIGDAIKHYKKYLYNQTAIAFCSSVRHAQIVADTFNENDIPAVSLDGNTPPHERRLILKKLERSQIKIVTSCEIISEGTDIPSVGGCLLLRPTLSLSVYLQQVGRCLRPQKNKTAIILDHVGNVKKHGLPNEVREWSLEGAKKRTQNKTDAISVKVCPVCFSALMSITKQCECGHVFRAKDQKRITIDTDLEEIKAVKKEEKKEVGRARTLAELLAVADRRGYNRKWAYHILKAREPRNRGLNY